MKKMIVLLLLVSLSGCVTYYYPETALEDGVYYAEDDPSYTLNAADYTGVVYYPWSTLDYFYLGYWPYSGYAFGYDYSYVWGYSPWGYPVSHYGFYPPRYFAHHRGYGRHQNVGRGNRYAGERSGNNPNRYTVAGRSGEYTREDGSDLSRNSGTSGTGYVITRPSANGGNPGVLVRSKGDSKTGRSRVGPTHPTTTKSVSVHPATVRAPSRPPVPSNSNSSGNQPAAVPARQSRQSSGINNTSRRKDPD